MSLLATGLASPDRLMFATEPITIVGEPGIEFKDASGNVVANMAYDGSEIALNLEVGTQFVIQQPNDVVSLASFSASGNMTIPNDLNGLTTTAAGIVVNPLNASVTLSPAQVSSLAGVLSKGIWVITGAGNSTRPPAFPGVACNVSIRQDPAGANVLVGEAQSFVGSDTSDSVGNFWLTPFCFMIPQTIPLDTTKSYGVSVTNGYVSTIQYVPLY